jgi:hypothetical protein
MAFTLRDMLPPHSFLSAFLSLSALIKFCFAQLPTASLQLIRFERATEDTESVSFIVRKKPLNSEIPE